MESKLRVKCPHCGKIANSTPGAPCGKCGNPIVLPNTGSCIYLYRQGSFYGVAGGFSIYINGQEFGSIGNRELLCIPLPYGSYNIHCAAGMSRKCRDLVVNLTPQTPVVYTKVYIKPGFWANSFVVEPMDPRALNEK